jgi:hypothetical protein
VRTFIERVRKISVLMLVLLPGTYIQPSAGPTNKVEDLAPKKRTPLGEVAFASAVRHPRRHRRSGSSPVHALWLMRHHPATTDCTRSSTTATACTRGWTTQHLTRTGLEWSDRSRATIQAWRALPVKTVYLDGELCAGTPDGVLAFSHLQPRLTRVGPTI